MLKRRVHMVKWIHTNLNVFIPPMTLPKTTCLPLSTVSALNVIMNCEAFPFFSKLYMDRVPEPNRRRGNLNYNKCIYINLTTCINRLEIVYI